MSTVLIAMKETEGPTFALSLLKTMAQAPENVILVHVQQSPNTEKGLATDNGSGAELVRGSRQATENKMELFKKEVENSGAGKVKTVLKTGVPSSEILKTACEENVELIVLGRGGKPGFLRFAAGQVAREVERNSPVPVLVAPNGAFNKNLAYGWRNKYAA